MKPRIVIITGDKPHMNYFISRISSEFEVVSVFYFKLWERPISRTFEYFRSKEFRSRNTIISSIAYDILGESNIGYSYADGKLQNYSINSSIPLNHCEDINSQKVIESIKELNPDLVFCHGGPIYKSGIINCAKTVINFHSGISPNYRGAHSHLFAYIDDNSDFIGGTLMKLNAKIDGGDIISKCKPKLNNTDTPNTIFLKIMHSGCDLVIDYLRNYDNYKQVEKQSVEGKYTKSSDFNFLILFRYYYRRMIGLKTIDRYK
ncbi:formyltransferase family protein [Acinetobacter sp. V91_7]|uniref:formyltransferase family protein n=1 Tax=unclassified Acinetobacter TaxID=196816 RepID=UPI00287F2401|nr:MULTISPECIES: formyltransferase family protein [unclassified Acinetobacter]MDS7935154.1 formyltransferase family protein [Acinetobacter sp. V91_4B]MDS7964022.1 formyltransferase family protein [Acinetobacter sp. V91_7]MDS8027085.1 formyltransferase family protein [Acinetobacter sp. V91_13]